MAERSPTQEFEEYLHINSLSDLQEDYQINTIGRLVDLAFDLNRKEGVEKAFNLARTINTEKLNDENFILYHYDLANGWNVLRKLQRLGTNKDWDFDQEEISNEIINLRIALYHHGFIRLPAERQCQILTNLGNLFSYIGRFAEAIEFWDRSIGIIPHFAMAIGNKGYALLPYGKLLRQEHSLIFFNRGFRLITQSLSLEKYLEPGAADYFRNVLVELQRDLPKEILENEIPFGSVHNVDPEDEQKYRVWCLSNRLFLHPWNDITNDYFVAYDSLMLPGILSEPKEPPFYHNFYNQLKQEFSSARYFAYEGIQNKNLQFADNGVALADTQELLAYSINLEKVKSAYRICYSLFDKIAYFVNRYFYLQVPLRKVNFRTIWYKKEKELHPQISASSNWALRGLYWLSKDLFEESLKDTIDPESKDLADLRNFLEHKSLKIRGVPKSDLRFFLEPDEISYQINRDEFEAKTLKILKLSRSALVYLTLAVSDEERHKQIELSMPIKPVTFKTYSDDHKV